MCQTNCIAVTRNLETRLHSTDTTYSTKDVRDDSMNSQLIRGVDEDRRYDSRSAERRLIIERDSRRPKNIWDEKAKSWIRRGIDDSWNKKKDRTNTPQSLYRQNGRRKKKVPG